MIIVLIVALMSQVGGSPKHFLVETKDEHKEPMKNGMENMGNENVHDDDVSYYSGSYEYESDESDGKGVGGSHIFNWGAGHLKYF